MLGSNSRLYTIILFTLLGISGVLYLLFVGRIIDEAMLINWCYILFIISAAVSVVFPVIAMVKDFKRAVNSLIGIAVLVIIFTVGYFMATSEEYKVGEMVVDAVTSQRSEAGLITFYFMLVIAVLTIIYTEISKAFK